MSLADKKKSFKGKSIDFMEGRKAGKLKDLLNKDVTIVDIDIIKSTKRNDEFAVFIIDEDADNYYFGGEVLTNFVRTLEDSDFEEIRSDGCKVKFTSAKSKDGFTYTNVDFL